LHEVAQREPAAERPPARDVVGQAALAFGHPRMRAL
jgi:hypothetical protein